MKYFVGIILLTFIFCSCKKTIEKVQEDLVIKAMTDGQWAVTSFIKNGSNITSDFTSYKFQYRSDKTVDALKNGTVEITGTWDGNASAMTTYANFNSPPYPITLINGSWLITKNSWTYVEASKTSGSETKTMRLDKQ